MKISFYSIMEWFQFICMILSFLFSLQLIRNDRVVKYMRNFYWYSVVAALIALLRVTSSNFGLPTKLIMVEISNYSILFHFGFLSMFIFSVLPDKKKLQFSVPLLLTVFSLTLFFLITYSAKKQNSTSYAISNLGLVIYCVIYYSSLFWDVPKQNLLKEPSFWIISGIFLCMSISIPINSLHGYLRNDDYIKLENRKNLFGIAYFAYGTLHLFLIKAYLCSIRPQKVS